MAEHAHIIPPQSRRRALFAAAGAVIIGGGITAGAAASVADFVPADTDAELIAACGRFCELERDFDVACRIDDENGTDVQTRPIIAMSEAPGIAHARDALRQPGRRPGFGASPGRLGIANC